MAERFSKRRKLSHSSSDGESDVKPRDSAQKKDGPSNLQNEKQRVSKSKMKTDTVSRNHAIKASSLSTRVGELIECVKLDHATILPNLKPFLKKVTDELTSAAPREPALFAHAEDQLRKQSISIPFYDFRPNADIKYKFAFEPPSSVEIYGSLAQGIATETSRDVEILVQMPESLFQEKDYLNYRAFHKRAFYLACLASGLSRNVRNQCEIRYGFKDANVLLPILEFQLPAQELSTHSVKMSIDVLLPFDVGPPDKTHLTKNCARPVTNPEDSNEKLLPPTPYYNSALRSASSRLYFEKIISGSKQKCAAFADACVLGHEWLQRRGFGSSIGDGGFGSFEWTLMSALLLSGGGHKNHPVFSDRYSSLQLFKAMLQVLCTRDLQQQPISIGSSSLKVEALDYPVLFDTNSAFNVLYKMTQGSYLMLQDQASISLTAMNARDSNGFEMVFTERTSDPILHFDEIYELELSSIQGGETLSSREVLNKVYKIFLRGLGDRVKRIALRSVDPKPSKLFRKSSRSEPDQELKVQVGLLVEPTTIGRTRDDGPTVEEQDEARDFREFWGEKAELRRFKDGRIMETLVWTLDKPITYQILQYLAARHFGSPPSLVSRRSSDLAIEHLSSKAPITASHAYATISAQYQKLTSKLHQLEGLPLPIRSIAPSDPALRSASQGHPLSLKTAKPIDVLIQFDSSARWPDNLSAIQYTKIAFLAKLADLLSAADASLSTRLGVENTSASTTGYFNTSFLDVIETAPGVSPLAPIIFRLRILHEREQQLLLASSNAKFTSGAEREILTLALAAYKRTFIASPTHTAAIRNLITHFPPLSDTIRLLKAWTSAHRLTNHFPEAIIEIVAASVFLRPAPWSVPGTATTAFLRCLSFLSRWDWSTTPLIVDLSLSQEMPPTSYAELDTRFQAWRKLDPSMNNVCWFVGTNVDNTGTIWTQGSRPARVVAGRMTALARAAIDLIQDKGINMKGEDWQNLFVSSLTDFDFVIRLKQSIVAGEKRTRNGKKEIDTQFKNLIVQEELEVDKIGHDMARLYLDDLEKCFGSSVLFFFGEGGNVIAGLWKPTTTGEKEWRVRLGYSSTPTVGSDTGAQEGQAKCIINKEGILAEIAILGEGMVEKITTR